MSGPRLAAAAVMAMTMVDLSMAFKLVPIESAAKTTATSVTSITNTASAKPELYKEIQINQPDLLLKTIQCLRDLHNLQKTNHRSQFYMQLVKCLIHRDISAVSTHKTQEGDENETVTETGIQGPDITSTPEPETIKPITTHAQVRSAPHPMVKRGMGRCIHKCMKRRAQLNFIQCKVMCH